MQLLKLDQKNKAPEIPGPNVVMEGIEPPTQGFSVLCSTN